MAKPEFDFDGCIAGIVLASGLSRRFQGRNKLLLPVAGAPMVRWTVEAYIGAHLKPVLVVVGNESTAVLEALAGSSMVAVENPDFRKGQSRALVRGVRALAAETHAAVIGVADQPFLTSAVIRRLVRAYHDNRAQIVVPRYDGRPGNPVLFDRELFPELLLAKGDRGGRGVIAQHPQEVIWVEVENARAGLDVDTEEEYRNLTER